MKDQKELWTAVFVASIRAGSDEVRAAWRAEYAVREFNRQFPETPVDPNFRKMTQ